MKIIRSTLSAVTGLLIGFGSACAISAADYSNTVIVPTNVPNPSLPKDIFTAASPLGTASAAYERECYDRTEKKNGNLSLTHIDQIDLIRCTRGASGIFHLQSQEPWNAISFLVLPWIEWVGGDFDLKGTDDFNFDEIRLTRFRRLDGKMSLDYNPAFEGLTTPALKTLKELNVKLRSMDHDLTGMNALEKISGPLRFESAHSESPPTFRGMSGLVSTGSLTTSGYGVRDDGLDPGLSNLRLVKGDVSISITALNDPPADYLAVYGTQAIEVICGNLVIQGDASEMSPSTDFPALQEVAGSITIGGINGNAQFPNVTTNASPADCP